MVFLQSERKGKTMRIHYISENEFTYDKFPDPKDVLAWFQSRGIKPSTFLGEEKSWRVEWIQNEVFKPEPNGQQH